jgi:hypothetical protein
MLCISPITARFGVEVYIIISAAILTAAVAYYIKRITTPTELNQGDLRHPTNLLPKDDIQSSYLQLHLIS